MTKTLRLSPNEAEGIAKEHERIKRIARLKQVRMQAKTRTQARVDAYQTSADAAWNRAKDEARDVLQIRKNEAASAALDALNARAALFGLAHGHARMLENAEAENLARLKETVATAQMADRERADLALAKARSDAEAKLEPLKKRAETMATIHETENNRAKHLVDRYREYESRCAKDVLPISQPLHKLFLNDLNKARVTNQTDHSAPYINYNTTRYHTNFTAVRLEPGPVSATSLPSNEKPSASALAPIAELNAEKRAAARAERAKMHKTAAEERFLTAITSKAMDSRKEVLCKQLEELRLEDRARKLVNTAGGPSNVASRRLNFLALNEAGRKEKFSKIFGIGDEPTFTLDHSQGPAALRQQFRQDRVETVSVADSIEFSRCASSLE
ncbi:hypothetical protein HDU77_001782 [Chytriomyces hyalinus]|nr:hypothetical protein HDU77_001782 [Chytriomyces hyalinus]